MSKRRLSGQGPLAITHAAGSCDTAVGGKACQQDPLCINRS